MSEAPKLILGQVSAATNAETNWIDALHDNYDATVAAFSALGFREERLPALTTVTEAIDQATVTILNQRKIAGAKDELVIAPSVYVAGITGGRPTKGMIPRFDARQSKNDLTHIWDAVFKDVKDKAAIHDNGLIGKFNLAVLLGDVTDPREPDQPANASDEPGLLYVNATVPEQRQAFENEAEAYRHEGLDLRLATIAQIIMINAKRRLQGKPMLDARTGTRLVQYDNQKFSNDLFVPEIGFFGDSRLSVGRSSIQCASIDTGIRRALVLPIEAEA